MQLQGNPDNRETYKYCSYKKCYGRYEKPLKNCPLDVARKYVETYSSPNAVAQNSEERVQINITEIALEQFSNDCRK